MKPPVQTGFDRWVEEALQSPGFKAAYDLAQAEIQATRVGVKHAPSKPLPSDDWEPTNDHLWERVLELARGDKREFTNGGVRVLGPNDGQGFHPWPNPNGSAWAVKQYNSLGGAWKKKTAKDIIAAKLTKDWISGIRRTWVKLMHPSISDWDDIERAANQLLKFVNALQEEVMFVRRGPYTSVPTMSEGKKLLDLIELLRKSVKDAKSRIDHWRQAYEGKLADRGFPVSAGQHMFDLYKKDFTSATETSVRGRGGKDKTVSLTRLFDSILKTLREDAARIEQAEAHGDAYDKANQPAFKDFDLNGVKVIVEDDSLTGNQVNRYIKFLDEARQRLQAKGLGKVWYGAFVIQCEGCGGVNHNTGGGVGGHYLIGPDRIGVFVRPTDFVVELVVHELGHRYWFKHMDGEQRARFESFVKVRPTPQRPQPRPEAPISSSVTNQAKKNVDTELKKLESALSDFEQAKGSFSKAISLHQEKVARAGYDIDIVTAVHSSQADATITPEVKALLYDVFEVHGKLKKFASNLEDIHARINSHPDGVSGEELFKIERKRWLAECRQYIEEVRAAAFVYIDAATTAWNENETTKNEKARKEWEEAYEKDSRPVLPVSDYASRSTVEAFAEVFTYYVLDYKLDRDQVDSFKAVIKKASFKHASFAPDEWRWLEKLKHGGVISTLEESPEDSQMERLRQRGLARCSGYSAHHRLWDITPKGLKVAMVGLEAELRKRVEEFVSKDPLESKDLLELGNWIDQNFRVRSAKSPKGLKSVKATMERMADFLKAAGRPGGVIHQEAVKTMIRDMFTRIEPQLSDIVKHLTTEGDAATGREVLSELKLSNATFLNLASLSSSIFKKYAEALNQVLDKLKGWRRKALAGNLKVEFVGTNRMSVAGKYVRAEDTMLVRATPKILSRSHGTYGAIDYILIHELGHRFETKIGTTYDFERTEWHTTRYSTSREGENFAELFALGHFKLTGNWSPTVEKFEALMAGRDA